MTKIAEARTILTELSKRWADRLAECVIELKDDILAEADGTGSFNCDRFWNAAEKLRDLAMINTFIFHEAVNETPQVNKQELLFNAFAHLVHAVQNQLVDQAVVLVGNLFNIPRERAEICVAFFGDKVSFGPTVFAQLVALRQSIIDQSKLSALLLEEVFGLRQDEAVQVATHLHQTYGGK